MLTADGQGLAQAHTADACPEPALERIDPEIGLCGGLAPGLRGGIEIASAQIEIGQLIAVQGIFACAEDGGDVVKPCLFKPSAGFLDLRPKRQQVRIPGIGLEPLVNHAYCLPRLLGLQQGQPRMALRF